MRLSIVVPALDEAERIAATLAPLAPLRAQGHEVIVVEGGSRDSTAARAAPFADRVMAAPRGRASQMNAGAAFARGEVLLFLHADSRMPADGAAAIGRAVARGARWGRFDVAIEGRSRLLPAVARLMNLRSRLTGIATGDQGIFVQKRWFDAIGGYPPLPLMEDVALSRALKRVAGRPACLRERIVTSGRRWDANGAWRTIATMWSLRYAYWRGADPARLALRYRAPAAMPAPTLIVFARDPAPGHVKTRLAQAIGPAAAAEAYRELVERMLAAAVEARGAGLVARVELWATPTAGTPAFARWRDRFGVELRVQHGDDLGARMRHALFDALDRHRAPALLVGTDCPGLDAATLGRAAAALADDDAVFVPAEDGGYVLVGLSKPIDAFDGIAWSTPGVMAATRVNLRTARARWRELDTLWDVDTPADFARWRARPA